MDNGYMKDYNLYKVINFKSPTKVPRKGVFYREMINHNNRITNTLYIFFVGERLFYYQGEKNEGGEG